ncbi:MAG: FtsK/SpoIIIE domain-containing protein [Planctomycetota bacterium]|jgi:S-DNA-T family DNA segregation ATPase FtsK/SpoIIIE
MYHLTPDKVRLVLIDPKRVEFGVFSSSLFNACDIITEFEEVPPVFASLVLEMESRYQLLEQSGFSDIRRYNSQVEPNLRRPYVVVVIDEFADLLMQNVEGFEDAIIRLAQKARASGIHLVLATQRPSADVIRGLLKTNIPGRIALSVSSQIDSKIILESDLSVSGFPRRDKIAGRLHNQRRYPEDHSRKIKIARSRLAPNYRFRIQ